MIVATSGFMLRPLAHLWLAALALVLSGCGDEIQCAQSALLVIQSPGATIASDADPATPGIQTDVSVRSTLAEGATVTLVVRTAAGAEVATMSAATDAGGDVTFAGVTVPTGTVTLEASADDRCGAASDSIDVRVFEIGQLAVTFLPPVADGSVGINDGDVAGTNLTLPICGMVDTTGAAVSITIDGGAEVAATVNGTSWCRIVTLAQSPPAHQIVATAASVQGLGSATLALSVDLVTPDPITDLAAVAVNRQRIRLSWTAPGESGMPVEAYVVKYATAPITDANFDTVGTVVPTGIPAAPGQPETVDVFPARTGAAFWVAAAATDAAGNRAPASIAGPVTPMFAQTGALTPGDVTAGNLTVGWAIASGRFNDDDLVDLAVAAPGEDVGAATAAGTVSVFYGSATGIASTPDLVIQGVATGGRFGTGLAAVGWTTAGRDDLVVGAPRADGGDGVVYVFHGGGGVFTSPTATAADADTTIGAAATPGWFAGANLGTILTRGHIDDDATDDLVIGAPGGGGARGGVVVIYGGTATAAAIGLSDLDPGAAAGAVATLIEDPAATTGQQFGLFTTVVGPTRGALDLTDDFLVGYLDDGVAGDAAYLFRPDGTRPAAAGVTQSGFVAGRDVRIELDSTLTTTAFAAQATTIEDQNGDGARDLVIAAHRAANLGEVLIVDGNVVGAGGVARTTDPGVVLTTIGGAGGTTRFGAAIAGGGAHATADIDGDGREDLMIAGVAGGVGRFYVWFGGDIPVGLSNTTTADYAITGPSSFLFTNAPGGRGPAGVASWVGDVDGDGLDDVCWSAPNDNARDGGFELLFE